MPEVHVDVGDRRFAGFESARYTQSLNGFAGSFQLRYTDRTTERQSARFIEVGDKVSLRFDGVTAFETGWVDQDQETAHATDVARVVMGKTAIGDLVECSATLTGRAHKLRSVSVVDICRQLTEDYQIELLTDGLDPEDLEPIDLFTLRDGETIAGAIHRACRLRGVHAIDRGGKLALVHIGREKTDTRLVWGDNILSAERRRDWRQRFSHYRFKGQTVVRDLDSIRRTRSGEVALRSERDGTRADRRAPEVAHERRDWRVPRLRRLEVQQQGRRRQDLGIRAELEAAHRSGRSETYVLEVPGWTTAEGDLWRAGIRVPYVEIPPLRAVAELIVVSAAIEYGTKPARHRTRLTLVPPQAFHTKQLVESQFDPQRDPR